MLEKPPSHFVPVARPKTFCWWVAGWDGKKFHYKMKGFTLLPPAKICITLSVLRGCQLPLSHLPHGKPSEQLQEKKRPCPNLESNFLKQLLRISLSYETIKKSEINFASVIPAGESRWEDPQNTVTVSNTLKEGVWLGAIKPDHPGTER